MADDRTAAAGDFGGKSLEAKKLAKDATHLGTLVLSLDMNLESAARNLPNGLVRTRVVQAADELDEAVRGLNQVSHALRDAGSYLESAGSPLHPESQAGAHYSYDRSGPVPGEVWAPKVVAVGGIPIEEYARLRGFTPNGAAADAKLHNEILSLLVDLKDELRTAERADAEASTMLEVKRHLQAAMAAFKGGSHHKTADVDHDFKSLMDTLVRTMASDIRELESAAEQVGRLDGGPGIARELHNLTHALGKQVRMVGEEVGKFTSWVGGVIRKGG